MGGIGLTVLWEWVGLVGGTVGRTVVDGIGFTLQEWVGLISLSTRVGGGTFCKEWVG